MQRLRPVPAKSEEQSSEDATRKIDALETEITVLRGLVHRQTLGQVGYGLWRRTLEQIPEIVRDVAGIAGGSLVAYGAALIYRPAGFIVGGLLLIAGAIFAALGSPPSARTV